MMTVNIFKFEYSKIYYILYYNGGTQTLGHALQFYYKKVVEKLWNTSY